MTTNLLATIVVVLTAWTSAVAEKLLSAEVVEEPTNYTNTTNGFSLVRTTNFTAACTLSHVLTTNVSERWPTHLENDFSRPWTQPTVQNAIGYMKWTPDLNPTNKWIRTTIKRQTFVDFTVEGTPFRGLLKEETLFDREAEWVLHRQDEWMEKNIFPASGK